MESQPNPEVQTQLTDAQLIEIYGQDLQADWAEHGWQTDSGMHRAALISICEVRRLKEKVQEVKSQHPELWG